MKRIFISYRSSDGRKDANRLAEDLSLVFGDDQVFYDKRDLQAGSSWRKVIASALDARPIVLLVLSPDFFGGRHADGRLRLDDADDPVRQELGFALQNAALVVPLRGEGVEMPLAESLPPELRPVTDKHAPRLRTEDWRQDLQRLVEDLVRQGLQPARDDWRSLFGGAPAPRPRRWGFAAALGLVALAGLGTVGYFTGGDSGPPKVASALPVASSPTPGPTPGPAPNPTPPASTAASSPSAVPVASGPAVAPRARAASAPTRPSAAASTRPSAADARPPASGPTSGRSPTDACRNAGAIDFTCMWRQCEDPRRTEFANHPECVKLREEDFKRKNLLR